MRAAELSAVSRADVRAELRENLAIMGVFAISRCRRGSLWTGMSADEQATVRYSPERSAVVAAAVAFVLGARRLRTAVREAQDLRNQAESGGSHGA